MPMADLRSELQLTIEKPEGLGRLPRPLARVCAARCWVPARAANAWVDSLTPRKCILKTLAALPCVRQCQGDGSRPQGPRGLGNGSVFLLAESAPRRQSGA